MVSVRFLVDGNNVMYALADRGVDAGRTMLSELLGRYAHTHGVDVTVVFDGPAPRFDDARRPSAEIISAYYSGGRSADDVLEELIAAYSAPRNLTVVSSDRQVRRAGRRRRCKTLDSASFARNLTTEPPEPPKPVEPPAKQHGLDEGQLDAWLAEFGMTKTPTKDDLRED